MKTYLKSGFFVLLLVLLGMCGADLHAADSTPVEDDKAPVLEPAPHPFKHHHLGVFLGYAAKDTTKRKDGFKVGLEYEYQFHELLGARAFVDHESGSLNTWLTGAGLSFHTPKVPLIFFVGGAFEADDGKKGAFLRVSAEYKIKLTKKLFVAPVVGYDAERVQAKSAWFAGAMVGTSF